MQSPDQVYQEPLLERRAQYVATLDTRNIQFLTVRANFLMEIEDLLCKGNISQQRWSSLYEAARIPENPVVETEQETLEEEPVILPIRKTA